MQLLVLVLHLLTFPQALQWCLLFVNVNLASQFIHAGASASGTHLGATIPRVELYGGGGPGSKAGGWGDTAGPSAPPTAPVISSSESIEYAFFRKLSSVFYNR